MNYALIEMRCMESPEFLGCGPVEQATWLKLLAYCCKQENGGVIESCSNWKNRKWEQVCRVTKDEIEIECDLWHYDGNTLRIRFYPEDQEARCRQLRSMAASAGQASARARLSPPTGKPRNRT